MSGDEHMREPSLSGKKAKPCNEVQDASAGTVGLHNTDLQENLDLHLNSRFIWHKACSCASQSALLISHQLIFFPQNFTFDANEKHSRSGRVILKYFSEKLPDNCNHSRCCSFSVALAPDILFTK